MKDRIDITMTEGVADVKLARPEKLNALDQAMFSALIEAGDHLAQQSGLRAVVLSGQGKAFCAGLDFMSFLTGGADEAIAKLLEPSPGSPANFAQQVAYTWTSLPVPVIAALHGVVYGGGLQIALGADIRVVHPHAKLSVMEIKWGLIPDMTGPQTLRHLVGLDVAKLLTFTGRVVTGEEALTLGLATETSEDPHATAMAIATSIASKSPDAIRRGKQLLNASVRLEHDEALRLEAKLQTEILGSANQLEAVAANLARRSPAFADPT